MGRLGRDIAPVRRPQPLEHLPQQGQDSDDLVALALGHVEPKPRQCLIQFLSGHISASYFLPKLSFPEPKPSWPGLSRPSTTFGSTAGCINEAESALATCLGKGASLFSPAIFNSPHPSSASPRTPSPACGGGLGWGLTSSAEAVGFRFAQRRAALGEAAQQGRGRPALAIALMPGGDLVVDLAHADRVGPEHQPAAIAREAKAVEPHDIDIAGAERLALIEDLARLIDRR